MEANILKIWISSFINVSNETILHECFCSSVYTEKRIPVDNFSNGYNFCCVYKFSNFKKKQLSYFLTEYFLFQ